MATAQNIIRTLTIRSTVEGADKTKADLKGIQSAHEGVARVTDTSAKGQLSLADAVAKSERRFNASIRAQQDFEKVQRQMNLAVAQNPALQARANAVLAMAATHFDQVSKGQRAFSTAMQAANDNLRGFAASAGPVGSVLSAMGPGGIAAAVGIGAAVIALHQMITAATTLADRAGKLKDFAETTGFTVIELQALEKAGAQVGVSAESVTKGLERFSVQMAEVKLRTGETYEKLLAVNPVLARQVAEATSLSKAYDLVSKAIKGVGLEQGNQLAKAFAGRGFGDFVRLARANADAGGLNGLIAELHEADIITAKQADRWDTLGDKIAENMKAAKQNIASVFTEDVLIGMERFSKAFLEFSREVKQFGINEDLKKVIDFFTNNKAAQGAVAGALGGGMIGGPVGAVVGAAAGAIGGQHIANLDTEKLQEEREKLDALTAARIRGAASVKYYQDMVFASDNPNQANDIRLLNEKTAALGRLDQRIADLRSKLDGKPIRIDIIVPTAGAMGDDGADRAAQRAAEAAQAHARLREEIVGGYNDMQRWIGVMGQAATMAERYETELKKLNAEKFTGQLATNQNVSAEESYARKLADINQQLELRLGVADMAVVTENKLAQIREVAAAAGWSQEKERLALAIATAEARERENQAWRRANPIMAELKDISKDFVSTAAKGFLDAKAGADSLSKAFESLALRLADKALEQFMSGEWEKAAVSAIMAVVSALISLVSHTNDLKGTIEVLDRLNQLRLRQVRANADSNTLAGQLAVFNANAILEQIEEARKGGQLMGALLQVQHEERLVIERDFAKQQIEIERQAADDRIALAKAIADRQLSFQDRLFAAANDNSTLAGQLAAFDRAAQRDIIAERDAGGQAMADLEAAQIRERFNLIRDFNNQAIEETRRAEQEKLDLQTRAARQIVDYVSGLQTGPDSSLAPMPKFAAADAVFNATYALAQGGNSEALGRVTQDFENARKANQAINASGVAYQNYLSTGMAKLLALPVVALSSDPVVSAIRDSILAQQATTARVGDVNAAVLVDTSTTAGKLDISIARFDTAITRLGQVVDNLAIVFGRLDSTNALLDAIRGLQTTAKDQLVLLTNNLVAGPLTGLAGSALPPTSNSDVAITLWRKMVYNTGIIAMNTQTIAGSSNPRGFGVFATGGILQPGGLGIFGEHHPDGPFLMRAGSQPVPITPAMPSNVVPFRGGSGGDNSEMRAIRQELADIKRVLASVGAAIVNEEMKSGKEVAEKIVGALNENEARRGGDARKERNNPQNKKVA